MSEQTTRLSFLAGEEGDPSVSPHAHPTAENDSAFHHALEVLKEVHGGNEYIYEQMARSWERCKTACIRGGGAWQT